MPTFLSVTTRPESKEFITHNTYAECLSSLMQNTELIYSKVVSKGSPSDIKTKLNLIKLTRKSLQDEYTMVQLDKEYSYACTSWLPIKTYYLLFNTLLTLHYVLVLQKESFNLKHSRCMSIFTKLLEDGHIEFSNSILNQVFDKDIFIFKTKRGTNLKSNEGYNIIFKLAIKKVALYKHLKWKNDQKVDLRTKKGKQLNKNYLNNFKISIFEFPYYMRIRANYKDMAFIEDVNTTNTRKYFESYYNFSLSFHKAIFELIMDLKKQREK